jgi:hypothetical protein
MAEVPTINFFDSQDGEDFFSGLGPNPTPAPPITQQPDISNQNNTENSHVPSLQSSPATSSPEVISEPPSSLFGDSSDSDLFSQVIFLRLMLIC